MCVAKEERVQWIERKKKTEMVKELQISAALFVKKYK